MAEGQQKYQQPLPHPLPQSVTWMNDEPIQLLWGFFPLLDRSHFNVFVLSINIFGLNDWMITNFHTKETCMHPGPMFLFLCGTQLVMLTDSRWMHWNEVAFSKYSLEFLLYGGAMFLRER